MGNLVYSGEAGRDGTPNPTMGKPNLMFVYERADSLSSDHRRLGGDVSPRPILAERNKSKDGS